MRTLLKQFVAVLATLAYVLMASPFAFAHAVLILSSGSTDLNARFANYPESITPKVFFVPAIIVPTAKREEFRSEPPPPKAPA
jgi:hypothetical protein